MIFFNKYIIAFCIAAAVVITGLVLFKVISPNSAEVKIFEELINKETGVDIAPLEERIGSR